jgi:hypothetical protein
MYRLTKSSKMTKVEFLRDQIIVTRNFTILLVQICNTLETMIMKYLITN